MFGEKGVVSYDPNGNPICHICGKSFKRLMSHVRQIHEISAREYKIEFGLDLGKGILSEESKELSRLNVEKNAHVVYNLLEKGKKTRFKKGEGGKTYISEQTLRMLKNKKYSGKSLKKMRNLGRELGKSGSGNEARWGKK